MKNWAIDIDGVITANPQALSWLTYHLSKNENSNHLFIITWRDGSDELKRQKTIEELKRFNIYFHELIMAPKHFPNAKVAAFWKIEQIIDLKIDIWMDDELKAYKRDFGIDLDKILPNVEKIWI